MYIDITILEILIAGAAMITGLLIGMVLGRIITSVLDMIFQW